MRDSNPDHSPHNSEHLTAQPTRQLVSSIQNVLINHTHLKRICIHYV